MAINSTKQMAAVAFIDGSLSDLQTILFGLAPDAKGSGQADAKNVWARTAGAWQGCNFVREPQGEYEQRLELK